MSDNIDRLEKIVEKLTENQLDTITRFTRLEITQENLNLAVIKVADVSTRAIESNSKLEKQVLRLEDRALNRLDLVEDSLNEVQKAHIEAVKAVKLRLLDIDKSVVALEKVNERKQGGIDLLGVLWNNGTKLIVGLLTVAFILGGIYQTLKPEEINPKIETKIKVAR